jgi:hypothetical protein
MSPVLTGTLPRVPCAGVLSGTAVFRRYAVAWLYLAGFCVSELWYAL